MKQTLFYVNSGQIAPWTSRIRVRLWLVSLYPVWLIHNAAVWLDGFLTNVEKAYMRLDAQIAESIRGLAHWLAPAIALA